MMTDDAAGTLQSIYQDIDFDGDTLPSAIVQDDGVLMPVRKICEALGLDPKYQLQRLREHDVLVLGLREIRIPIENRLRAVAAIQHRYIPFWLATITPHQVSDAMRPKLVRYQRELVDVLAQSTARSSHPTYHWRLSQRSARSRARWRICCSSFAWRGRPVWSVIRGVLQDAGHPAIRRAAVEQVRGGGRLDSGQGPAAFA